MAKDKKTGLTMQQEKFCRIYVNCGNASAAYRSAYRAEKMKPSTVWEEASRLLNSPKITARVEQLKEEDRKASIVDRQKIEQVLVDIVTADPTDVLEWDEERGKYMMVMPKHLPKRVRNAIKHFDNKDGKVSYDFHGKVEAARLLASMNGWEKPKEISVSGAEGIVRTELRIGFDDDED